MKKKQDWAEIDGVGYISPAPTKSQKMLFVAFIVSMFGVLYSILVSHDDATTFISAVLMLGVSVGSVL